MDLARHIRTLYETYPELVTKGDVDAIVALYADDATVEDPIGSDLHEGSVAIRAFYETAANSKVVMKRTGPVRVAGTEAACPLIVILGADGDAPQVIDIISVMTFSEDGKVTSMRAFWSADAIRPATSED